ncbi:MAG: 4Fe-4S cluster-binding domain-containing protein [Clostridiaceae bacterium]|nr:4Fe-4S cluster-binding domain-containing protein [Clostridiaceae bacterium]
MRISGVIPNSLVAGKGLRYTIFLQGCPHHCEGCHNKHTWSIDGGFNIQVDEIAKDISIRLKWIDGITLSGGEPYLQEEECIKLLELLPKDMSVWVYTGYLYEEIKNRILTQRAEYVVDGKFEPSKKITGRMYGSSNQNIICVKNSKVVVNV